MGSGSGLGGCYSCIKYVMFAFNFIFWLIGCALVGLGIWILVDKDFAKLTENTDFSVLQYMGIAAVSLGGVVMIIGFFGCCGAIRESQCLLVSFFICLFILFAAMLAGGIYIFINRESFTDKIWKKFDQGVDAYGMEGEKDEETKALQGTVDIVQSVFACCGRVDPILDYGVIAKWPESCPDEIKPPGCQKTLTDTIEENGVIFAGVAIGVGVIMLLGMVFAMLLCCAIRDNDRD